MAIVLPQGRFNNSTDRYIRNYIIDKCRILAVVGLHGNVFKPHTGTKTSILFVQKWDEKICPKKDDYSIFFATMQKPSKDSSGEKIYVKEDFVDYRKVIIDENGKQSFNIKTYLKKDFIKEFGDDFKKLNTYRKNDDNSTIINEKQYEELLKNDENNAKEYNRYELVTEYQKYKLDTHGHLIVDHDLFNHDGLTNDGIAEAFAEFAKKEKLSFF